MTRTNIIDLYDRRISIEPAVNLGDQNLTAYICCTDPHGWAVLLTAEETRRLIEALEPYATPPIVIEPSPPLHFDIEVKLREPKYRLNQKRTNGSWWGDSNDYPGEYTYEEALGIIAASSYVTYKMESVDA